MRPSSAMPAEATSRVVIPVEVLRDGRSVPLLPVLSTLSSSGVRWDGVTLNVFTDIPACEIPQHVHPTHMVSLLTGGSTTLEWTTGGRTRHALNAPGDL